MADAPWVAINIDYWRNPKVAEAGFLAATLNLAAIAYCAEQLTDGFIPQNVVRILAAPMHGFVWVGEDGRNPTFRDVAESRWTNLADDLVGAGLWHEGEGGWWIVNYLDHQPSREQVEKRREQAREAGRIGGQNRAAKRTAKRTAKPDAKRTPSEPLSESPSGIQAPVPVPRPTPKEQPPTTSVAEIAPTQRVIASYVEAVQEAGAVLDKRAKGRIAKETPELLAAGADLDLLCEAARRLAVNGYADLGAEARRLWAERNHRPRSTTDQRVAQGLALVAHFTEKEAGA